MLYTSDSEVLPIDSDQLSLVSSGQAQGPGRRLLRSDSNAALGKTPGPDTWPRFEAGAAAAQAGRSLLVDSFVLSSNTSGLKDNSLLRTEAKGGNRTGWMSSRFQFRDDWPWEVRWQRQ